MGSGLVDKGINYGNDNLWLYITIISIKQDVKMTENTQNPFQWTSNFSVDVDELDDDHKMLFELLDYLNKVIESKDASALPLIVDDLQQYTIYHFRHEEDMMKACHYQYMDNHVLVHRMLESKLDDYVKNSEFRENLEAAAQLLVFFEDWLKDHIAGMDKTYSSCIQAYEEGHNG